MTLQMSIDWRTHRDQKSIIDEEVDPRHSAGGRSTRPSGCMTLQIGWRHEGANWQSLVIQENADPAVLRDLARWMSKLAPESADYEHDAEGPDDMPGHIRSAVTRSTESIPVTNGALALGTWQAIYVWEHRTAGHRREIVVHVVGE